METQNKSDDACTKTPLIEVYYTSRSRFGDKFTDYDAEGCFQKIYPSISEVKAEWKQVPSFAIDDMIRDNTVDTAETRAYLDDDILRLLFVLMNDYDTNILAGYDNQGNQKMDHIQPWVQSNQTHTSMSVNDVIAIDDVFYLCDDIGWFTLAETPLLGKKYGPFPDRNT
jgi:hypothetical protein